MSDIALISPELPDSWVTIATRPRGFGVKLIWREIKGAPLAVDKAQMLAKKGQILMANRHTDDVVELVVRPKAPVSEPGPDLKAEPPFRLRQSRKFRGEK